MKKKAAKKGTQRKAAASKKAAAGRKKPAARPSPKKKAAGRRPVRKATPKKTKPRHQGREAPAPVPRRASQELPGAQATVRTRPPETPAEMARSGLEAFDAGELGQARRKLMELVEHFDGRK
ncbi:MAG: hypothetical protein WD069_20315 [Planctomycetales bacterium]